MAGPGGAVPWLGLELLQVDPATVARDGPAQPLGHPFRHGAPAPAVLVGCRSGERLPQLLLQRWRQARRHAPRGRVLPIVHALGAVVVVAARDRANPIGRGAGHAGQRSRGPPLRQQSQNLPPTALMRLFGGTIPPFQIIDRHMGVEVNASRHAPILQPPITT